MIKSTNRLIHTNAGRLGRWLKDVIIMLLTKK
jgi:hypothetical protein